MSQRDTLREHCSLIMMKLENVLPWGRCFDEYVGMFNLSAEELGLNILDCAGGPSSFNVKFHVSSIIVDENSAHRLKPGATITKPLKG